jgi:hypothetical protein
MKAFSENSFLHQSQTQEARKGIKRNPPKMMHPGSVQDKFTHKITTDAHSKVVQRMYQPPSKRGVSGVSESSIPWNDAKEGPTLTMSIVHQLVGDIEHNTLVPHFIQYNPDGGGTTKKAYFRVRVAGWDITIVCDSHIDRPGSVWIVGMTLPHQILTPRSLATPIWQNQWGVHEGPERPTLSRTNA